MKKSFLILAGSASLILITLFFLFLKSQHDSNPIHSNSITGGGECKYDFFYGKCFIRMIDARGRVYFTYTPTVPSKKNKFLSSIPSGLKEQNKERYTDYPYPKGLDADTICSHNINPDGSRNCDITIDCGVDVIYAGMCGPVNFEFNPEKD